MIFFNYNFALEHKEDIILYLFFCRYKGVWWGFGGLFFKSCIKYDMIYVVLGIKFHLVLSSIKHLTLTLYYIFIRTKKNHIT